MKSMVKFLPIAIALTLLTAMYLLTTASGSAVAGTVALDKSYITTPGGTIQVTLTDADLNTGVSTTETSDRSNVTYAVAAQNVVGSASDKEVKVKNVPIMDANADGVVNAADVRVMTTSAVLSTRIGTWEVWAVDADDGSVTVRNTHATITTASAFNFKLTYTAPAIQHATVKIASTQDTTGFNLTVRETGANTGIFTGTFKTLATTSTTSPIGCKTVSPCSGEGIDEANLGIDLNGDGDATDSGVTTTAAESAILLTDYNGDGDYTDAATAASTTVALNAFPQGLVRPTIATVTGALITVTYDDAGTARTASATVETTKPSITIVSPTHNAATRTQSTRLIAEITDADAGVDNTALTFSVQYATTSAGENLQTDGTGATTVPTPAVVATAISGGYRIESQLSNLGTGTHSVGWFVTAADKAGNVASSDQDATITPRKNQEIRVDTDAPALASSNAAVTGQYLDAANAIITDSSKADPLWVHLKFNEELDGTTLAASDFKVAGVAPAEVKWVAGATKGKSVFLKVAKQASDAKPKVEVVSAVGDRAGNTVQGGLSVAAAVDGIAPTVTVTISPTSKLDKAKMTIDVQSDEALLTAPTVTVNAVGTGAQLTVPSLVGTNLFRSVYTAASTANTGAPNSFNVQVSSTDTTNNTATSGVAAHDDAGAILFEIDNAIPAPTLSFPGGNVPASVYTQNPFITIDWTTEGTEYGVSGTASGATPPRNDGTQTVDTDTHNKVTLNTITLDGVDVSADVLRVNDGKFLLSARNLTLAEHTLKITGADDAGNTRDVEQKFTIKERAAFSLTLSPGWNLVSLPGEPKTPAINDAIALTHKASIVLTYDPSAAGGWLTATRPSAGTAFAGTLTTLSSGRAYWVYTDSFDALKISLQTLGAGTASQLPTVNLVAGWNLIPVLDVTGTKVFDGGMGIGSAYIGTAPRRAYEWDIFNDRWANVPAAAADGNSDGDTLDVGEGEYRVGRGYWVYMAAATVLVP